MSLSIAVTDIRFIARGNTALDLRQRLICVGHRSMHLTPQQRDVLAVLFGERQPVARAMLLDVMRRRRGASPGDKAVDVQVHWLRRVLRDVGSDARIVTMRGEGYVLVSHDVPLTVRAYTPAQADALARCLAIARASAPDLVALVEM